MQWIGDMCTPRPAPQQEPQEPWAAGGGHCRPPLLSWASRPGAGALCSSRLSAAPGLDVTVALSEIPSYRLGIRCSHHFLINLHSFLAQGSRLWGAGVGLRGTENAQTRCGQPAGVCFSISKEAHGHGSDTRPSPASVTFLRPLHQRNSPRSP